MAALDVSTGSFKITQFKDDEKGSQLINELQKLDPREILIPQSLTEQPKPWLPSGNTFLHSWEDWTYSHNEAVKNLLHHFKTQSLEGF